MRGPVLALLRNPSLLACSSILLVACAKGEPPAAADAGVTAEQNASATATARPANTATAAPSGSARAPKAAPSRADRTAFLKLLEEGRKKARAKDFAGALAAFDKALAITPNDARVLSEIGWAALNTGDLDRAEKANRRALALTKQPVLRAQILYNVGRVAEAKKDNEAARKAYAESLALRDNAEVKKRLAGAGGAPEDVMPCAAGAATVEALCKCLLADKDAVMIPEGGQTVCKAETTPALGDPRLSVVLYGAEMMGERSHLLLARDGKALRPVARLGLDYEPGAFGIHNEGRVVGGEAKTIGKHHVIVLKSEQRNADMNMAGLELCEESEDLETVCALGSGTALTRCFTVPVRVSSGCGPGVELDPAELDDDTKAQLAELKKGWSSSEVKLSWTLGDDGKIAVKKVSGADGLVRAGLVGSHALVP